MPTKRSAHQVKSTIAIVIAVVITALLLGSSMYVASQAQDNRNYAAPRNKTKQRPPNYVGCDWNSDGRVDCNPYTQVCQNNRCVDNGEATGVPCDWNADGIGPDCDARTQRCAPDGSRCIKNVVRPAQPSVRPIPTGVPIPTVRPDSGPVLD